MYAPRRRGRVRSRRSSASGLPARCRSPSACRTDPTTSPRFVAQARRTAQRLDVRTLVIYGFMPLVGNVAAQPRVLAAGQLHGETDREWANVEPGATALIQLTSGSTGHPRGVVLSHRAVLANLAANSTALPAGDDAREVTWFPLHHDMGLVGGLLYPLYNAFAVNVLSPLAFRSRPVPLAAGAVRREGDVHPRSAVGVRDRDAHGAQGGSNTAATSARCAARWSAPSRSRRASCATSPPRLRPAAFGPGVLPGLRPCRGDRRRHVPGPACAHATTASTARAWSAKARPRRRRRPRRAGARRRRPPA